MKTKAYAHEHHIAEKGNVTLVLFLARGVPGTTDVVYVDAVDPQL